MRNQDVGLAFFEFFINALENRRTVSAGKTSAPHSALTDLSDEKTWRSIKRHCRRHPNLTSEYAAQTGYLYAANVLNSAVEIMFSERRPPKTVINKV